MKNQRPISDESARDGQRPKSVHAHFCHRGSLDGKGVGAFIASSVVSAPPGDQKSTIPTLEERLAEANERVEM